jgi:hypothetical protein
MGSRPFQMCETATAVAVRATAHHVRGVLVRNTFSAWSSVTHRAACSSVRVKLAVM